MEKVIQFFLFLYCSFIGHDWENMALPDNRRIKRLSQCQRCGHVDYELYH